MIERNTWGRATSTSASSRAASTSASSRAASGAASKSHWLQFLVTVRCRSFQVHHPHSVKDGNLYNGRSNWFGDFRMKSVRIENRYIVYCIALDIFQKLATTLHFTANSKSDQQERLRLLDKGISVNTWREGLWTTWTCISVHTNESICLLYLTRTNSTCQSTF